MRIEQLDDRERLNILRNHDILRCAIYIRVSTAEQRIEGWSLQAQEAGLRKLAEDKGWKVVGVYADEGKSARKRLKGRKAIFQLMEDVKAGLIDRILFKELDRWMRNVSDFYKLQDILDEHGVKWVSERQPHLGMDTKEDRLQVNLLLSVGQNETDTTSDRIKYTNKYLRSMKRWTSGAKGLPRGYTLDEDNHVIIDPVEGEFTKALIERVIQYGSVYRALMETNQETDRPMHYPNAQRMLGNPLLYGAYKEVPDFVEKPFLTKERFDLLQSNIRRNARKDTEHIFIFSGMLHCGECGRRMAGCATSYTDGKYIYYRCNAAAQGGGICGHKRRISEKNLEKWLMVYVKESVDNTIAEVKAIQHAKTKKPKKRSNRDKIEKQLKKLKKLYVEDEMTWEEYQKEKEEILSKLVDENPPEEKLPELADLEKVKAVFEGNIEEVYVGFAREERREFWRGVLDHIVIENNAIKDISFIE